MADRKWSELGAAVEPLVSDIIAAARGAVNVAWTPATLRDLFDSFFVRVDQDSVLAAGVAVTCTTHDHDRVVATYTTDLALGPLVEITGAAGAVQIDPPTSLQGWQMIVATSGYSPSLGGTWTIVEGGPVAGANTLLVSRTAAGTTVAKWGKTP